MERILRQYFEFWTLKVQIPAFLKFLDFKILSRIYSLDVYMNFTTTLGHHVGTFDMRQSTIRTKRFRLKTASKLLHLIETCD